MLRNISLLKIVLLLQIAVFGLLSALPSAKAADYPDHTVVIVVPFPAGGTTDLYARFVAEQLQKRWGQPVIVENRPGAAAAIGTEAVAKSAPDGYTILLGASYLSVAPSLFPDLPYDPLKDLQPTGVGLSIPLALFGSPGLKVKTLDELLTLLKAKPDGYNFASAGNATLAHLAAAKFQRQTGTTLTHIAYQGTAPALLDVSAERSHLIVEAVSAGLPYVETGQLVPIVVTSAQRQLALPDVPTAAEAGLTDFLVEAWNTFFVPAGASAEIVQKLNADLAAVMAEDATKKWLAERSLEAVVNTPDEFSSRLTKETRKWGDVIKSAGIKAE